MTAHVSTERPVLRCSHCELTQFATTSGLCRRCGRPLGTNESDTLAAIGPTIRLLRQAYSLSQATLARRAQISRTALARIEAGEQLPRLPILLRLGPALTVPTNVLLHLSEVCHG